MCLRIMLDVHSDVHRGNSCIDEKSEEKINGVKCKSWLTKNVNLSKNPFFSKIDSQMGLIVELQYVGAPAPLHHHVLVVEQTLNCHII